MIARKRISVTLMWLGAALFSIVPASSCLFAQNSTHDVIGKWRGEFMIRDGIRAPFNFEIKDDGLVVLRNGKEEFETGRISLTGDSLFIPLDQFDNELAFRVATNSMTGVLRKQDHTGQPIMVTAEKGRTDRFVQKNTPSKNIEGQYEVTFEYESGKREKAVAIFYQEGNLLTGTFLKPSGDTRFLEGIVDGNQFYLSSFIGSSPGYYEGRFTNDGKIEGIQAGTRIKHRFNGVLNANASIRDPYKVSSVNSADSTISFSLPDLAGHKVSLTDEKYRNKVVILAITGTWCPNCIDEAQFLSPWYKKNRDRGVEIITIHYERQSDTAFTNKVMSRFRKRFDIQYDQVFGGIAHADTVSKTIKGLQSFSSFPTTIFVDKKGRVAKIHAGYTGPATGRFYDEFVKEFNDEVDRLLSE